MSPQVPSHPTSRAVNSEPDLFHPQPNPQTTGVNSRYHVISLGEGYFNYTGIHYLELQNQSKFIQKGEKISKRKAIKNNPCFYHQVEVIVNCFSFYILKNKKVSYFYFFTFYFSKSILASLWNLILCFLDRARTHLSMLINIHLPYSYFWFLLLLFLLAGYNILY